MNCMFTKADISYRHILQCSKCGRQEIAQEALTIRIRVNDLEAALTPENFAGVIEEQVNGATPRINIGWGMFGHKDLRCPDCLTNKV